MSTLGMISIQIWETPLSWHAKCSLPFAVRASKTRVLKFPIGELKQVRHRWRRGSHLKMLLRVSVIISRLFKVVMLANLSFSVFTSTVLLPVHFSHSCEQCRMRMDELSQNKHLCARVYFQVGRLRRCSRRSCLNSLIRCSNTLLLFFSKTRVFTIEGSPGILSYGYGKTELLYSMQGNI